MQKRLFILLMIISAWSFSKTTYFSDVNGISLSSDRGNSISVECSIGDIRVNEIKTTSGFFDVVKFDNAYFTKVVGEAQLPLFRNIISMPTNSNPVITILDYDVKEYKAEDLGIKNKIVPVQPSYSKSVRPEDIYFRYNQESYQKDNFGREELASVKVMGTSRGIGVATLTISPVQYNPVKNIVKVYRNIKVKIDFEGAERNLDSRAREYSPYFEGTHKYFLNKPQSLRDNQLRYPVSYLIAANNQVEGNADLERFIAWKREKGFNVVVKYFSSSASVSEIDNWIEGQYENINPAPSFVLLIGDMDGNYKLATELTNTSGTHASDLHYGVIGEVQDNNHIPSIYVGRFSMQTEGDLKAQVDKTIWYEKEQFVNNSDLNYLKNAMGTAGADAGHQASHGNPHIRYAMEHYFNNSSYQYPLYNETPSLEGIPFYNGAPGQASTIVSKVSQGVSYYNYTAHGSETNFSDPLFSIDDINSLNNQGKYGLIIGNCCLTGTFTKTECFGEAWLNAPQKGSIGFIGASNYTYWDEDLSMGVGEPNTGDKLPPFTPDKPGMVDGLLSMDYATQAGVKHVGLLAVDLAAGPRVMYYYNAYHLFGDPSIMPFVGVPSEMDVSYDDIAMGSTELEVDCPPRSLVAISSSNGELLGTGRADNSGKAMVTFKSPIEDSKVNMFVSGQFKKPYIAEITTIVNNGPFLKVENYTSEIEAGQTSNLDMTIKNSGVQVSSDITVKLAIGEDFTDANLVEIGNSSYNIPGSIDVDGTHEITGKFDVKFSTDLESGVMVPFVVTMTDNFTGKNVYSSKLNIKVLAPNITYEFDSNGILLPNETHAVKYKISNTGTMAITNFELEISEVTSTGTVIEPSTINVGTINAESSYDAQFNLKTSDVSLGTPLTLKFNITASNGYTYEDVIETVIGEDKFEEDFESLTTESYGENKDILKSDKYHWTVLNANEDDVKWILNDGDTHDGEKCIKISYIIPSHNNDYLVTPPLQIHNSDEASLSFWTKQESNNYPETCEIFIAELGAGDIEPEVAMFTNVISTNSNLATYYQKQEVSLAAYKGKRVYIAIKNSTKDGYYQYIDDVVVSKGAVSYSSAIDEESSNIVKGDVLYQNYPNPFNPTTSISFNLNSASNAKLMIFNVRGQLVKTLNNSFLKKGLHSFKFDASSLNSGVYYYNLKTPGVNLTKKMILIK